MITSITSANAKVNPSPITIRTFTDLRYLFLAIGSSLVALGRWYLFSRRTYLRGITSSGLFIPYFYIVEYAQHLSIAPQMSFYVLAVMNGGGFFGRIAPAYLSDIIGRFNILMPSAFFSGVGCLLFWMFSKSLAAVIIFAVAYGFFSGAFISVVTPCVAQISDMRQIGTRIGMLYTIISFP
jgi:MFS family permease